MKSNTKLLVGGLVVIALTVFVFWATNLQKGNSEHPAAIGTSSKGAQSSPGIKRFVIESESARHASTVQTGESLQFLLRLDSENMTFTEAFPEQGVIVAVLIDPNGAKSFFNNVTIDENFWRILQQLVAGNPSFSRRMPIADIRPKIPGTYTVSADIYYPFPPKGHGGKVPNIEIQNYVFTVTPGVEEFLLLRDFNSYKRVGGGEPLARRDGDVDTYDMNYQAVARVNGILGSISVTVADTKSEARARAYSEQAIETLIGGRRFLRKKETTVNGERVSVWENENPKPDLPSSFIAGWVSGPHAIILQGGFRDFGLPEQEVAAAYLKKYPVSFASGR